MASAREKVTGGPLGKKAPMKILIGSPASSAPMGPEGKTLTPRQGGGTPDPNAAFYAEQKRKNEEQIANKNAALRKRGLPVPKSAKK